MEEGIKIHPDKTFTKSEYSREFNIDRPKIDKLIKENILKTLKVILICFS